MSIHALIRRLVFFVVMWAPALAWSDQISSVDYDIYRGDINGDSFQDLYLKRKPATIILATSPIVPVTVARQGSFKSLGNASGMYTTWTQDESVNVATLTKVASSVLRFQDFDEDGIGDVAIGGGTYTSVVYGTATGTAPTSDTTITQSDHLETPSGTYPPDLVGALQYDARTGPKGDAVLDIPLLLPPGVRNLVPRLSLHYESSGAVEKPPSVTILGDRQVAGLLGYGWALAGLSELRRCRLLVGGSKVLLDASDMLCLDGQVLLKVAGASYWSDDAQYRLGENRFIKIVARGTGLANRWFEAFAPNGDVLRFGDTPTSKPDFYTGLNTTANQWSLTQVQDDYGNTLTVSYDEDVGNKSNFPTQILYNNASIQFFYQTRHDTFGWLSLDKRSVALTRIQVLVNGLPVREYRLDNEETTISGQPVVRLKQFQACGFDTSGAGPSCIAPLQFFWGSPDPKSNVLTAVDDGTGATNEFSYYVVPADGTSPHGLDLTGCSYCNYATAGPADSTVFKDTSFVGRAVVSEMRRPDGLGGHRRTTYLYNGYPLYSTLNLGFVGFPATAVTEQDVPVYDPSSGTTINRSVATYFKNRLDYPLIGKIAARMTTSFWGTVRQEEFGWKTQSVFLNVAFPYVATYARWDYESNGSVTSAQDQDFVYCFRALSAGTCPGSGTLLEYPTQVAAQKHWGSSLTNPSFTATRWGDMPNRAIGGEIQYDQDIRDLGNDATNWVIGFPAQDKAILDTPTQPAVTRTVQRTQDGAKGAVKTTAVSFPGDPMPTRTTTNSFDPVGNLTSVSVAATGITTRVASFSNYLDNLFPQTVTNPKSDNTTFQYDERFGVPTSAADRDGIQTLIAYDPIGRIESTEREDGTTTTYSYESCAYGCSEVTWAEAAQKLTVSQTNGGVQTAPERHVYLDVLGRTVLDETEAFVPGDGWRRVETHYDTAGRVSRVSLPYLSIPDTPQYETFGYDIKSRRIRDDRPDSSYSTVSYTGGSGQTTVQSVERVLTPGAAYEDQTKVSVFNAEGQLTSTTDASGTSKAVTTTYTYDATGNLDVTVVNGVQVVNVDYDAAGNRKQIVESNSGTTLFTSDALGQLTQSTNAKGQITKFTYDSLGRVTQRIDDFGGATAATYNWSWDPLHGYGNLATRSRADGSFSETSTYDAVGNPNTVSTSVSVAGFTSNSPYVVDSDYVNGRLSQVTYPSGIVIGYDYTSEGYLQRVRKGSSQVLDTFNAMDAFGSVVDESFGNGLRTTRDVDASSGRTTAIRTGTQMVPESVQNLEYVWRSNGALFKRSDLKTAITSSDDRIETATYDALNRLTTSTAAVPGVTRTLSFGYDLTGNLTSKTSNIGGDLNATGYTYGTTGKPHRLNTVSIKGISNTLSYDLSGCITTYDAVSGDDTFVSYDGRNQATKITVGASSGTATPTARDEFWYDPDGERFLRKASWNDSGTQRAGWTLYLQGGVFEEVRPGNTPATSYYQKLQVTSNVLHRLTKPVSGAATTTVEYTHRDHLGSITVITDGTGAILQDLGYDPFGTRRANDWTKDVSSAVMNGILADNETRTSRGFTDHEHLDRTGFIHMNGRVFDGRIGRFLQPDPFEAVGYSQSYNRYAYVFNDPLSLTDPSGFDPVPLPYWYYYGLGPFWNAGFSDYPSVGYFDNLAFVTASALAAPYLVEIAFHPIVSPAMAGASAGPMVGMNAMQWGMESRAGVVLIRMLPYAVILAEAIPPVAVVTGVVLIGTGIYVISESKNSDEEEKGKDEPLKEIAGPGTSPNPGNDDDKRDKQKKGKPQSNVEQNKRVDDAAREAGLNAQQRRELGRFLEKESRTYGEDYSYSDILDAAERLKAGERLIHIK